MDSVREHVQSIIQKHLPSKQKEKSELGEVFTPIPMIETSYSHFPKKVWTNPSYTWLDPAAGIGNFPLVLFFWLMDRLDIPNKAKHIIEKMIFIVEINPDNVAICKKIFKSICPTATPNIYQGDFLTLDPTTLSWPTFDVIIGNPPYNIGGTGLEGSKRTHIAFTEVALRLLTPRGYLSYICPPSYRESGTHMNQLFHGRFHFIKIYGAQETFSLFHIQGRVDCFVFQKGLHGKGNGTTVLDDEYNVVSTVTLDLNRHIPNFGFSIFEKMYNKVDTLGHIDAFRNTEMSSVKADTFGCGRNKVLHLIVEKGKRVFKTLKKHTLASTPKILVNGLGVPYVYHDKGEYGPSQSPVIILKPSKNIVNLLQSPFFSFVAWGLRLTGNNNLPYLFNAIPDIRSESNPYKTMADIKKGFHLTASEVTFINDHFHKYEYNNVDIVEKCNTKKKKR